MPTVFVPQVPRRKDKDTGLFIPVVNIAPAEEHGKIHIMLPPTASFHATGDIIDLLKPQLKTYSFEDGDSVMAIGDPSILAVVLGMLGKLHGKFYLLKWDRMTQHYFKIKIVLP